MPVVRCPACAAEVPAGARFCPRCGVTAPRAGGADDDDDDDAPREAPVNLGKLPSRIPLAGIVFLVALVVGPAAVVAGILTGTPLLIYGGIAVAIAVVILLLLGMVL